MFLTYFSYRSPSPQQRSYHSNNRNNNKNVYFHHRTRNLDRNANKLDEHADKFLVSATKSEQLDNKSVLSKDKNYTGDTPSKRVQMIVPSQNVNQHLTENTTIRKGIYQHTSSHRISSNESQYFSVKGVSRYSISSV
jgi:hypothetical protein